VAYQVTYSAAIKRLERTVCPMPASSHNARTCNHDLAGMVTICLRHGSADPITAYNPLRVESAQRVDLQRDLAGARSVCDPRIFVQAFRLGIKRRWQHDFHAARRPLNKHTAPD
jgi:hypothetical protein